MRENKLIFIDVEDPSLQFSLAMIFEREGYRVANQSQGLMADFWAFDLADNLVSVDEVNWEGDVINLKCMLQNWVDEPTSHSELHWDCLNSFVMKVFPSTPLSFEGVTVEIVSEGKMNGVEMLSSTKWNTIAKIIDGKITTEIEWKREAEIVKYRTG